MAKPYLITGIDIGTSTIRAVVGSSAYGATNDISIIGVAEVPAQGISKGSVVGIEDTVSAVTLCLEGLEHMVGVPVESAYIGIANPSITSLPTRGVVAVSRVNGEVREEDVDRAIEAAQAVATPPNSEILHVIPHSFTIDQQSGIKDPVGMTGVRLEVEAKIIQGLAPQIRNVTKAIFRAGIDIDDLVFSILAAAESTLTARQKELGVAVVDIGSALTTIAVFEEGDLLATGTIPLGGSHVTSDVAIGLRTSLEVAEKIKREHGTALTENVNKREEIDLSEYSDTERDRVPARHVAEIIEARVEEIFEHVNKELEKCGRAGMLPAGLVLVGGGAKLAGVIDEAKRVCRLPVALGFPVNVPTAIEKVHDPSFAAAVGLIAWGRALSRGRSKGGWHLHHLENFKDIPRALVRWMRSLLP